MRRLVVLLHKVEKRNDDGLCILSSSKKASAHSFAYEFMREGKITDAHLAFDDITLNSDEFPCDWITLEEQIWRQNEEQWEDIHTIAMYDCCTKSLIPDGERPKAFYEAE